MRKKIPKVKISELSKQIRGVTYSKADARLTPNKGFLPILRANNITDSGILEEKLVYVPESKISPKQRLQLGDILIAASSGSIKIVGKAAPILKPFLGSFGAFCKVVRPNAKVYPGYLAHYFKTPKYRTIISGMAAGANINNLRNEHIDSIKIFLPDLAEQKRIANILDKADDIRRKRKEALQLADDFLRSLFIEMFGDPVTNPEGWDSRSFGKIVNDSFRNGLSPSSRGTVEGEVLTLSAITSGNYDSLFKREAYFDKKPGTNQLAREGIFLICRGNGNRKMVGIGVFADASSNSTCFPDTVIACDPNTSAVEKEYLRFIWSSHFVRQQIESGARTTNGTFKINQQILSSISILVPPKDLQQMFGKIVRKLELKKRKANVQLDESNNLFAALQQRAFRGEL